MISTVNPTYSGSARKRIRGPSTSRENGDLALKAQIMVAPTKEHSKTVCRLIVRTMAISSKTLTHCGW